MYDHAAATSFAATEIIFNGEWQIVTCSGIVPDIPHTERQVEFTINGNIGTLEIVCAKAELGNYFTGWVEPKFDALRLLVDKPTPQKNLLDNGDLRNPVNQREQQKYTNAGYTVDRWMITAAQPNVLSVEPTSAGLKLTSTEYGCRLRQILEFPETYSGKTVTFTAILATDCTGIFNMWIFGQSPTDNGGATYAYKAIENAKANTPISITATLPNDNRYLAVQIRVESGTEILQLAKLEPGPRFTGWNEPKPTETLMECQRHQVLTNANHYFSGAMFNLRAGVLFIPLPTTLRTTPVLVLHEKGTIIDAAGNRIDGDNIQMFVEKFDALGVKLAVRPTVDMAVGPMTWTDPVFLLDANL